MKKRNLLYKLAFGFIMLLNVATGFVLFQVVLAQNMDGYTKSHSPIVAEVAKYDDCPIFITIVNIDSSNPTFDVVNFTVQNVGNKAIRAFVIFDEKGVMRKTATNFFPTKPFQIGSIYNQELIVERENVKSNMGLLLSMDYIEFTDGTSWGKDTQKKSEQIAGEIAGVAEATTHLKNLISNRDYATLNSLMQSHLVDLKVSLPMNSGGKSEKWVNGYRSGYRSLVGLVKNKIPKNDPDLIENMRETIKGIDAERRQHE